MSHKQSVELTIKNEMKTTVMIFHRAGYEKDRGYTKEAWAPRLDCTKSTTVTSETVARASGVGAHYFGVIGWVVYKVTVYPFDREPVVLGNVRISFENPHKGANKLSVTQTTGPRNQGIADVSVVQTVDPDQFSWTKNKKIFNDTVNVKLVRGGGGNKAVFTVTFTQASPNGEQEFNSTIQHGTNVGVEPPSSGCCVML